MLQTSGQMDAEMSRFRYFFKKTAATKIYTKHGQDTTQKDPDGATVVYSAQASTDCH